MKKKLVILFIIMLPFIFLLTSCKSEIDPANCYTVTIIEHLPNLENNSTNKINYVKKGKKFSIKFEEKLGYKFVSYKINDSIFINNKYSTKKLLEDMVIEVTYDYATDEIGIVNIDTDGVSINSREDYVDMTFSLTNTEYEDISLAEGEIRLRGNTTSGMPKKPYRIKFSEKQSIYGLTKAKSWVLLADYLDPSTLHNYIALSLGNDLDGLKFTPTPNKVNVYLNGEYKGIYTICEQIQENKGRIDIEKKVTDQMTSLFDYNFFISMDYPLFDAEDAKNSVDYIYFEDMNKFFELKYPEYGDFKSKDQYNSYVTELRQFIIDVINAFKNKDIDFIESKIDVYSLIDFLLVDEIIGERDHYYKSFNMYFDSKKQKLFFGPIWDYDWVLYTAWTGKPNQDYSIDNAHTILYSNLFYQYLVDIPQYYEMIKSRYTYVVSNLIQKYIDEYDGIVNGMKISLEMNNKLWYSKYSNITNKNVDYFKEYLIERKKFLDELYYTEADWENYKK